MDSRLTPGITRRPERWQVYESGRVGGRVHAVVRLRHPPERFKLVDDSFFPQPAGANNFTVITGAPFTIYVIPMVLRLHRFAVLTFINPPAKRARKQHTPEGAPPIWVLILK